ncbi:zinc-dependent peptidase [Corallococcus praedator]|uniref:Zinc-dependent peptidase n=1 Tax=Corallococcus praedator TaxID=2316724 RepID=A0ABX9QBQ1_9BACT|nr:MULTISPECIES: M90 family metallopeptidase [Corallococcus]RKH05219.1 zinc-dependent peptidase [Corallococcus sp. CA047B]RKH27310.1 zinc-dependent peptidase [Corallococcus sp. CA031C]RKH95161.1 zinc-dependent peptidase [Corallococcus praedator]
MTLPHSGLFRTLRRRRWLRRPFPPEWSGPLERHVPFAQVLAPELRQRFLDLLKLFIWEKEFIGAGGFTITDEVRVVVSATAVRLVLHLDLAYYDRLREIIVYPDAFRLPDRTGVVLGEAKNWGSVILSWQSVLAGLRDPSDGHSTATHEFAHVLDREDGSFDGTPQLRRYSHYAAWASVMGEHYLKLREGRRPERAVLDDYGGLNEAEFFAVATESFFEKPRQMKEQTPDLYEELMRFYGWDPARG